MTDKEEQEEVIVNHQYEKEMLSCRISHWSTV